MQLGTGTLRYGIVFEVYFQYLEGVNSEQCLVLE